MKRDCNLNDIRFYMTFFSKGGPKDRTPKMGFAECL